MVKTLERKIEITVLLDFFKTCTLYLFLNSTLDRTVPQMKEIQSNDEKTETIIHRTAKLILKKSF